ncbi:MAG: hypothetical protein WC091_10115 [Sulfuricellaceae bacterium]
MHGFPGAWQRCNSKRRQWSFIAFPISCNAAIRSEVGWISMSRNHRADAR